MQQITLERAREVFSYEDGILRWKVSLSSVVKVGDIAGFRNKFGYLYLYVDNQGYFAHKIIYLLHHGFLPSVIDHIDGNKRNNRIENLRDVSLHQNQCNRGAQSNNTSGYKGVTQNKRTGKWVAQIGVNGEKIRLGSFKNPEDAALVYAINAFRYHGEYAKLR